MIVTIVLAVVAVWLIASVLLALVIGRAVKLADRNHRRAVAGRAVAPAPRSRARAMAS